LNSCRCILILFKFFRLWVFPKPRVTPNICRRSSWLPRWSCATVRVWSFHLLWTNHYR
jgi:hypothetical protein